MGVWQAVDGLACRIAGHIWLQQIDTEPDGVKVCLRCEARDDTEARRLRRLPRRLRTRRWPAEESLVPEHRPWLNPLYYPYE